MCTRNVPIMAKLFLLLVALFLLSMSTSAQIDNCCNVDRQCQTDDEWVAGYYAFQNNQCGLPSQQQQSTPAPARQRSGASAGINNCCFSGWQCDADEEWTSGYFAFQHDHCFSQSHWEEQMRKRQSGNQQAQAKSDSPPRQAHGDRTQGRAQAQAQGDRNERQVQWETRAWHACGTPCPPPNPNRGPPITISIDLNNPNKRLEEADDGTPVVVDPELPD